MSAFSTMAAPVSLERSRDYCERLTKAYARNFYYGLRLLPAEKRASMYALYAWMRLVDDIADQEDGRDLERRMTELDAWRADTHAVLERGPEAAGAYAGRADAADLWPAFSDMARRHEVPRHVFDEVIAGQVQDLNPARFETFDELRQYCYRVAGVVGLASIHVWGFEGGAETEKLAIERGLAFQLTNIVRDIREDLARGRNYLPAEDVQRFIPGHSFESATLPAQMRELNGQYESLLRFQIERAEDYYKRSAALEQRIAPDCRPTLVAMTEIYHGILRKMARRPLRVLTNRVSLSLWSKLRIGWRALRAK